MSTVKEPARTLEVAADADVVVAGGGPGGFPAAVAAARTGAKVILVERYGFLGGLATAGLTVPILGHTAAESHVPIVKGLLEELVGRMHALGGAPRWEETLREWGVRFDAEAFKRAADQMAEEAGVRLMLHTLVAGTIVEDGRIRALVVESKSGRQAVTGRLFVDGTGDADVAFRSGAPTRQGRDFDGRVQSMGSFMHIGGIAGMTEEQKKAGREILRRAMEAGRFRFYNPGFTGTNTLHGDHFSPNMTRVSADPTNVWDLSRAEVEVRREVWSLLEFLRAEVPGCEKAYLHSLAPQVGARESRQIVGRYVMTAQDVQGGRKFDDAVARGSWWIDIHCPLGHTWPVHLCVRECPRREACPYWAAEHEGRMVSKAELSPPKGDWYDIPYRALVAGGVDNLLVSGRAISATHEAMAGARVMGTCIAIGQAAGTAAALAARAGKGAAAVDTAELRRELARAGALV